MKRITKKAIAILLVMVMAASVFVASAANPMERGFLPVRVIFEDAGAEVTWNNEDRSIHVIIEGINLVLLTGAPVAYVNDETVLLQYGVTLWENTAFINAQDLGTVNDALILALAGAPAERPVYEGFTDYPIIIGEGTDFPLDGILSIPDNAAAPVPAVVIVAGSGPNDMHGTIGGNTVYRDIAEFLAANGIAVIRHDKRTLTHGLRMAQELGGSATIWEESIEDAIFAADILRADPRIDADRIFILGHSLGGMIAPRIYANGGDFAGLILMAGTPRHILELTAEQIRASIYEQIALAEMAVEAGLVDAEYAAEALEAAGFDAMLADIDILEAIFESLADMSDDEAKELQVPISGLMAYYYKDMLSNFTDYVQDITVPILVMQGGRDFQVLADVDFVLMQEVLAGRDNVTFSLYEDLNHLFVPTTAGNFTEHAFEILFNPGRVYTQVLQDIVDWVFGL